MPEQRETANDMLLPQVQQQSSPDLPVEPDPSWERLCRRLAISAEACEGLPSEGVLV